MKLWQKDKTALKEVETFTVGKDREMDLFLAPFDVLGSLAHIQMLESVGLLTKEDLSNLQAELKTIYSHIQQSNFALQPDVEDIHSQVELLLTQKLGDAGKKYTVPVVGTIRCWWTLNFFCVARLKAWCIV